MNEPVAIDKILPVFKRALSLSKMWYDQTKNYAEEKRWDEDFQAIERKLLHRHEKFLPHPNIGPNKSATMFLPQL